MTPATRFLDLFGGWKDAQARYEAAPPTCPCRAVSAPAIAGWVAWSVTWNPGSPDLAGLEAQEQALRELEAAIDPPPPPPGTFALDVRSAEEVRTKPRNGTHNIPLPELPRRLSEIPRDTRITVYCATGRRAGRAVNMLRAVGIPACNAHKVVCEFEGPMLDPHIGGPADALMGLFGDATRTLATGAAAPIGEAVKGQIPAVAQAVKAEVPGIVQTAAQAARPAAREVAGEAGKAAGRAAVGGAAESARGSAVPVVLGVLAMVGAAVGIGYALRPRPKGVGK